MSNRWLRFVLASSAVFLSSNALAQWVKYSETPESVSYYQPSKVQMQDGWLYISALKNYQSNQSITDKQSVKQSYLSVAMTVIVKCAKSSYAISDLAYHSQVDGRGQLVYWVTEKPDSLPWKENSPTSDMAPLIQATKKLCIN